MEMQVDVILDAGHGGLDGGAVSADGVCEAPITLVVAQKTQALFGFCGKTALMTRNDDTSLGYRPDASARENKNADLHARLEIARDYPECPFVSIHLNKFSQPQYAGAQVFYGGAGEQLAQTLQEALRTALDPENQRVCKPAPEGVFLMKNIQGPAVTVECGFLSNEEECAKLQRDDYQTKIALALVSGYERYSRG
ncbi:MAG: N-acetylmuramoyl-L-alanine amidase [Clostridia bacterium]|nr:N-acetylmuramoyl-L-alanine amidase [Clostridia bacterium]